MASLTRACIVLARPASWLILSGVVKALAAGNVETLDAVAAAGGLARPRSVVPDGPATAKGTACLTFVGNAASCQCSPSLLTRSAADDPWLAMIAETGLLVARLGASARRASVGFGIVARVLGRLRRAHVHLGKGLQVDDG
ncbi:hypothetical protein LZ30DRAFT_242830 [Colletotrichum cereale]|nr:hypothetical protein LZ30DRAFT_242830 [Colletotrichum cereale]